jgi:hypothetical protein
MIPNQRRQCSQISWGEHVSPLWLRQYLLEHGLRDVPNVYNSLAEALASAKLSNDMPEKNYRLTAAAYLFSDRASPVFVDALGLHDLLPVDYRPNFLAIGEETS